MAETSRLWAEFRLAVVGHLFVGDLDRGQLGVELKSLSAKKWKHPITGTRVTFGYSTIERWYYSVLNNPKARLSATDSNVELKCYARSRKRAGPLNQPLCHSSSLVSQRLQPGSFRKVEATK